jgi:hypothetical protein
LQRRACRASAPRRPDGARPTTGAEVWQSGADRRAVATSEEN